jgi:Domain of unknown function (DUF4136)
MMNMKKNVLISCAVVSGILLLLATSCQKQPLNNLTNEESRVYITNYDTTADFQNYKTFSIVDSVALVSNSTSQDRELTQSDAALLQEITTLMEQRGYQLVDKSQNPDLAINVTKVSNSYTGVSAYPGYWDNPSFGYWDPYYWGYDGYDYYFPTTYAFYQYTQSYISIDVLDLKNAAKNNDLKVIWNAQFEGENVDDPSVVTGEVQAAFNQSTYLNANK